MLPEHCRVAVIVSIPKVEAANADSNAAACDAAMSPFI